MSTVAINEQNNNGCFLTQESQALLPGEIESDALDLVASLIFHLINRHSRTLWRCIRVSSQQSLPSSPPPELATISRTHRYIQSLPLPLIKLNTASRPCFPRYPEPSTTSRALPLPPELPTPPELTAASRAYCRLQSLLPPPELAAASRTCRRSLITGRKWMVG